MTITKSGALASFYTVNKAPIKHLRVYFSPRQTGSGTASPENIRPVEGWNSINFLYSGKNLVKNTNISHTTNGVTFTINTDGSVHVQGTATATTWWSYTGLPTTYIKAGTYRLTGGHPYASLYLVGTDDDGTEWSEARIGGTDQGYGRTFTLTQGATVRYQAVVLKGRTVDATIYPMLTKIEEDSTFTPYKGINNIIDFPQTIYGGYVDLITGELVETYTSKDLGDMFWQVSSQQYIFNTYGMALEGHKATSDINIYSSIYKSINGNIVITNMGTYGDYLIKGHWSTPQILYIKDIRYDGYTADQFTNAVKGIKAIYELETPITHYLTPLELQTFVGRNNIWSNADRIEVEYDLAESNDELYRRRNILLQGAPHLETATGNIANFKTDLIAPIKEAKVYFEPKQLGSGDPSPSNVREIVGENSIKINQTGLNLIDLNQLSGSYSKTDLTCTIDNNTISLTANTNLSAFGQYTAIWYLPPALLGQEVYIGCTEVVHPEREYFSTVVCEFRDKDNVFISDPTVITTISNVIGRKIQIPSNADRVEFYFRIAQNGKTVGIPQGDTVVYKNFYVRWPADNGGYEEYNGQTLPITFPAVGKNLFDKNAIPYQTGKYIYDVVGGIPQYSNNSHYNVYRIPIKPATTYTFGLIKGGNSGSGPIWATTHGDGIASRYVFNAGGSAGITHTFTSYSSDRYLLLSVAIDDEYGYKCNDILQVEEGSTATAYEPYEYIYGGYIDLLTGEIKCDWVKKKLTDFTWHNYTAKISYYTFLSAKYDGVSYRRINTGPIYSDTLKIYNDSAHLSRSPRELTYNNGYNLWIMLPETMESDAANAWIAQNYPDASICFQIESPITIGYINPIQLKTLKGTNNIWSSANGPVSIKYWTH